MTGRNLAARVGDQIRRARLRLDWTQAHLALACGVTQTAVSYWETGKREPGLAELRLLAEKLGVPVCWLVECGPLGRGPVEGLAGLAAREAAAAVELGTPGNAVIEAADARTPTRRRSARAMRDNHAPVATRAWRVGDPEPEGVTAVVDWDGDRWDRREDGRWACSVADTTSPWAFLLKGAGPLTEVVEP